MRPHLLDFKQVLVQPELTFGVALTGMNVQWLISFIRIEKDPPASEIENGWHNRVDCRREDSNLHTLYGYQVLNLARLPIPPLRLGWFAE